MGFPGHLTRKQGGETMLRFVILAVLVGCLSSCATANGGKMKLDDWRVAYAADSPGGSKFWTKYDGISPNDCESFNFCACVDVNKNGQQLKTKEEAEEDLASLACRGRGWGECSPELITGPYSVREVIGNGSTRLCGVFPRNYPLVRPVVIDMPQDSLQPEVQ